MVRALMGTIMLPMGSHQVWSLGTWKEVRSNLITSGDLKSEIRSKINVHVEVHHYNRKEAEIDLILIQLQGHQVLSPHQAALH